MSSQSILSSVLTVSMMLASGAAFAQSPSPETPAPAPANLQQDQVKVDQAKTQLATDRANKVEPSKLKEDRKALRQARMQRKADHKAARHAKRVEQKPAGDGKTTTGETQPQ